MGGVDAFDDWAEAGRDREMADRHWRTAKYALGRIPIEPGDVVLDLGTGSGYAVRAMVEAAGAGRGVGIDASMEMCRNARSYTEDETIEFVCAEFEHLPLGDDTVDHAFSMEAIYYADVVAALREIGRVLRGGGTVTCAVDFYQENHYSHGWMDTVDAEMRLLSAVDYRHAFRSAGLHVASQDTVPDREREIPPANAFPTGGFESRESMVERYRELGTLVTIGVSPQ